jgi:cytochrome c oxidase subunit IV
MAHHSEETQVTVLPPDKEKIKKLWTVAGILGAVTAVEFVIDISSGNLCTCVMK